MIESRVIPRIFISYADMHKWMTTPKNGVLVLYQLVFVYILSHTVGISQIDSILEDSYTSKCKKKTIFTYKSCIM